MSTKPNVLVLTGFGLNCDHETAYAFELAGAVATRAHINALIAGDVSSETTFRFWPLAAASAGETIMAPG